MKTILVAATAVLATAGCGTPAPPAVPSAGLRTSTIVAKPTTTEVPVTTTTTGEADTDPEQAFIDALRVAKVPISTSGQAEVQIGRGICTQLASGSKDAAIVRDLGPIGWTAEQGQAIVDAARAHLC